MMYIKELHVLVGLPGSGKTYFANKECATSSYGYRKSKMIVDFDSIYKKYYDKESQSVDMDEVKYTVEHLSLHGDIVYLDGLFLTTKDVISVLSLFLKSEYWRKRYKVEKICIDYWTPDIDACLWNDKSRRNVDSKISIKGLKIEKPNQKEISEFFSIPTKVLFHSVVRKPEYLTYFEDKVQDIKEKKYLYSDSWCLGGTGHGWDGSSYRISAETPLNFDAFDDLLESICPEITFLQYKKLYNHTVRLEERSSCDYYSDANEGFYTCDLEKLFIMLKDMGYIAE